MSGPTIPEAMADRDAGRGNDGPLRSAIASTPTEVWVDVVALDKLIPGRGVAALVDGRQVAVFLVDDEVYAVDNLDPFSGANVMSRGIVGDRDGVPKVASPMYKQSFDLRTGRCLDDDSVQLTTFPVQVVDRMIQVQVT